MSKQSRDVLKKLFAAGRLPSAGNFADLIDSMVNFVDDKTLLDTINAAPVKTNPLHNNTPGGNDVNNAPPKNTPANTGINNPPATNTPPFTDVPNSNTNTTIPLQPTNPAATAGMPVVTASPANTEPANTFVPNTKTTSYNPKIAADGKWHKLLVNLQTLQAMEIIAVVKNDKGNNAVLHGTLFAGSPISVTQSYKGYMWHNLVLRWTGDDGSYNLEIKTKSNYGDNCQIHLSINPISL